MGRSRTASVTGCVMAFRGRRKATGGCALGRHLAGPRSRARPASGSTKLCDACHGTGRVTPIERDALLKKATHGRHAGGGVRSTQTADRNRCSAAVAEAAGLTFGLVDEAIGVCEAFLAPRVLIKEATADVEIPVIAGWQGGPLVFGKPLRESDHSAGRRRRPA